MRTPNRAVASALAATLVLAASFARPSPAGAVGAGNDLLPDIAIGSLSLALREVVDLGGDPVIDIAHAGDDSGRLFLVLPQGVVRILTANDQLLATPFLNAPASPPDRAMSGLAFHPDYPSSGRIYVITGEAVPNASTPDYSPPQSDEPSAFDNVLVEYQVSAGDPDQIDTSTRRELLRIHQAAKQHNMNDLVFGSDGFLYIAVGDGGNTLAGTPATYETNAQDTTTPHGSVLRIDIDQIGPNGRYAIPPDNPFASGSGGNVPEIYAWGLRNPWRITHDAATGDIWVGNNGFDTIESIYRVELGENYGWSVVEGSFLFDAVTGEATVDPAPDPSFTTPVAEWDHNTSTVGFGSVIGGPVFRGLRLPGFYGRYLCLDFVAARMIAMDTTSGALEIVPIDPSGPVLFPFSDITFGEDESGELYVATSRGRVFRVLTLASLPALPPWLIGAFALALAASTRPLLRERWLRLRYSDSPRPSTRRTP